MQSSARLGDAKPWLNANPYLSASRLARGSGPALDVSVTDPAYPALADPIRLLAALVPLPDGRAREMPTYTGESPTNLRWQNLGTGAVDLSGRLPGGTGTRSRLEASGTHSLELPIGALDAINTELDTGSPHGLCARGCAVDGEPVVVSGADRK
jgi:hypothetical protein